MLLLAGFTPVCYLLKILGIETEIRPLEVGLLVIRTEQESSIRNIDDVFSQEKKRERILI